MGQRHHAFPRRPSQHETGLSMWEWAHHTHGLRRRGPRAAGGMPRLGLCDQR